jgi:epoxyqueuosine reductase
MSGNRIRREIEEKAKALGFDAVGFARADEPLEADFERYEQFVDAGMHGEMGWLADAREARRRLDRDTIQEGAKTIICVAKRYQRPDPDEGVAAHIARYARGRDYHRSLRRKVRQLATFIRSFGAKARPMMDEEPVLERAWAVRAGLGVIGKNGLLIIPGIGSMVLLGEVVTTLDLEPPAPPPLPMPCGKCTACIDVCPTKAITRPFVVDPRRCIAYLTIESRSAIPVELRKAIGDHLFGCDDCQTVCPFNVGKGRTETLFEPLPRWRELTLEDLLFPNWDEIARGSAVHRATADGLARNAAIVLGNRAEAPPGLVRAAEEHPSPMVRESAKWALNRAVGTSVKPRAK